MLAFGVLLFVSPVLLARYRERRAQQQERTRASGVHARVTMTNVRMFFREHVARYRVTMRFTDQNGDQRWFTQATPGGARAVEEGRCVPRASLRPGESQAGRSLVVDWPTW